MTGSLLLAPRAERLGLALALVRTVAGLQLTTIGFFLSLVLSLPWWIGPVCLFAFSSALFGAAAFAPPHIPNRLSAGGVGGALVASLFLAPVLIASVRMGSGEFPPVFFNVDSAYFLEKVHALVDSEVYPPTSLSVLGGQFAYHFGTHGIAAAIARGSGLAPHHALFLVVLPLLACGVAAAVALAARWIAPAVPMWASVALLLTLVPNFWYPFWHALAPAVGEAVTGGSTGALRALADNYEFWGVTANTGQNLWALFVVLASLAAIAAAPSYGWPLAAFFVGSAVLFKAPTGVALCAGFGLAQVCRAFLARSLQPLLPLAGAAAIFGAVYGAFWILPGLPVTYRTDFFPLFHLSYVAEQGRLGGLAADLAWLFLPAIVILIGSGVRRWRSGVESRSTTPDSRSDLSFLPLVLFALAPLVVVNLFRAEDLRPGRGTDFDWLQVLLPVPVLVHACVLAVANGRWNRVTQPARIAFLAATALVILPSTVTAARYVQVLISTPERGHEFADNRAIGEALKTIPVRGSIVVTNDLRYPADGFARQHRQLQVSALFGHQAFAVNYAYEAYPFSADRRQLQELLQAGEWSNAIDEAARMHGWTHLLVRKDYAHPDRIPLARVFENAEYAVYRFEPE